MNPPLDTHSKFYWMAGPLRIEVLKGSISINGAVFRQEESIVIHKDRSYVAMASEGSELEVHRSPGSAFREAAENEIRVLQEWFKAASHIIEECKSASCTIAVIGPPDSGKTSFSIMLANMFLEKGVKTRFLDCDPGQTTIGVPGFLSSMLYDSRSLWPREMGAQKYYYVGGLSPRGRECEMFSGVSRLLSRSPDVRVSIIDTDGWVSGGRALYYKSRLILESGSTHVVIIYTDENEAKKLSRISPSGRKTIMLESPPTRRKRPPEERGALRGDKLSLFLQKAFTRTIPLSRIIVYGRINLGAGEALSIDELKEESRLTGTQIIYGEKMGSKKILIAKRPPRNLNPEKTILPLDELKGRIAAIVDGESGDHYPAIIEGLSPSSSSLILKTIHRGKVSAVIIGDVIIKENTIREK